MTRVEANVWRQRREGSKLVTDDVPPHEVIDQAVHAPLVRAAVHFEAALGSLKPLGESGRHGLVDALRRILARLGAQGVPSGAGVGDRLSGHADAARADRNVDAVLESRVSFREKETAVVLNLGHRCDLLCQVSPIVGRWIARLPLQAKDLLARGAEMRVEDHQKNREGRDLGCDWDKKAPPSRSCVRTLPTFNGDDVVAEDAHSFPAHHSWGLVFARQSAASHAKFSKLTRRPTTCSALHIAYRLVTQAHQKE
jgi:hypothetical protein